MRLMRQTMTLRKRRRATNSNGEILTDERGNDLYEITEVVVPGVYARPVGGEEDTDHRHQVRDQLRVYAPVGFEGQPQDSVVIFGREYEITSPVQIREDPDLGYSVFRVTRWTG